MYSPEELALFEFMSSFDDDELPNGAWQQMLEDSVNYFNKANGTDFDEYDMFIAYCQYNKD